MKADKQISQTVEMGIAPLSIEYHRIEVINSFMIAGYRTELKINSVQLGQLGPEQYRIVTNRNSQSVRLATWCFKQILVECSRLLKTTDGFVSVYFPAKMLIKNEIDNLFSKLSDNQKENINKICIEFSSDILLYDINKVTSALNTLKEKYNIKTILSEFGDEFCPILRLKELPFDMVILDKSMCKLDHTSQQQMISVINIVNSFNMKCILESNNDTNLRKFAFNNGCKLSCNAHGKTAEGTFA